jgi:3-deoxy-manno-octulosonate cytidylyltransferase (CMP-KDO synthetase)
MAIDHAPFVVLIPARLASTRLPNKPLADLAGAPMVVRVAQRAALSHAARVVVAADDHQIVQACQAHGVAAVLTHANHVSGSDRLAQACEVLGLSDDTTVVNVQGDEPLMDPNLVNAVAATLAARSDCVMASAAHPITNVAEFANRNVVKVVCDLRQTALYFSRATIPFWRDAPLDQEALPSPAPLRHIGVYAYRAHFLQQFPKLSAAPIEQLESLEQLRVLWHGYRIAMHITPHAPGPGVDTPEDLERARLLWSRL